MSEHIVRWFALMRVQEIEVETLAQLPPDKRPARVLMPLWTALKADDDGGMHCEGDGQYTIIAAHVSEYDLRVDRQTTEEQARSRWASRRARLRFLRGVPDGNERGLRSVRFVARADLNGNATTQPGSVGDIAARLSTILAGMPSTSIRDRAMWAEHSWRSLLEICDDTKSLEARLQAVTAERDGAAKELAWFKCEDLAIRMEIARAGDGESARAAALRCRDERAEARERALMIEADLTRVRREHERAIDDRDAMWATAWADAANEPLKLPTPATLAATASLVFSELEARRKEPSHLKAIAEELGTFDTLPNALEGIRALKGVVVAQERQLGHIRRVLGVADAEATEAAAERLVASLLASLTCAGVHSTGNGAQEYAETIREIVDSYNEQRKCIEKIAGQVGRFVSEEARSSLSRWVTLAEQGVEALLKQHDEITAVEYRACTVDALTRSATMLECDPSLDAVLRAAEGWKIKADARQIVIDGYTAAARTAVDDPPGVVDPARLRGWIEGLRQDRADLQTIGSMLGLGPAIVETASPSAHQVEWPPGARVIEAVRDLAEKAEKDRLEASATTALSDRIARAKAALEAREGEGLVEAAGRCMADLAAARRELEEMGAEMVAGAGVERVVDAAATLAAEKETTALRELVGRLGGNCPLCGWAICETTGGSVCGNPECDFEDPPRGVPEPGSKDELRQILEGQGHPEPPQPDLGVGVRRAAAMDQVGRELARARRLRAVLRSFIGDRLADEQFEALIDAVRDAMHDGPRPVGGDSPAESALRFGDEDVLEMIADDFTDRVAARTAELAADILTGRHRP